MSWLAWPLLDVCTDKMTLPPHMTHKENKWVNHTWYTLWENTHTCWMYCICRQWNIKTFAWKLRFKWHIWCTSHVRLQLTGLRQYVAYKYIHLSADDDAHETWHRLISLFPFSKVFLRMDLSAPTVRGTTRGNLLSGEAACFWNIDLDKTQTTTYSGSLTAQTLSLDRGHSTLQLSVSLKQRCGGNCVRENGNMTPCVKR